MIATGVRTGEALALQWPDVSPYVDQEGRRRGRIHVRATLVDTGGSGTTCKAATKTGERGGRVIDLATFAADMLWRRRGTCQPATYTCSPTRGDGPISPRNLRRALRGVRADTPLDGRIELRDIRRSVATRVRDSRGIAAAGALLGHSTPHMTEHTYTARHTEVAVADALENLVTTRADRRARSV